MLISLVGPVVELGGLYDPSLLPDFDPKLFGLVSAKLAQQEVFTKDGSLVAPWETKDSLRPGTFVAVEAALIIYHFCGASASTVCDQALIGGDTYSPASNRCSRSRLGGSRSWKIPHWTSNLLPHWSFQRVLQRGLCQSFSLPSLHPLSLPPVVHPTPPLHPRRPRQPSQPRHPGRQPVLPSGENEKLNITLQPSVSSSRSLWSMAHFTFLPPRTLLPPNAVRD